MMDARSTSIPSAVGVAVEKFHQSMHCRVYPYKEGKLIKQGRMADHISKA